MFAVVTVLTRPVVLGALAVVLAVVVAVTIVLVVRSKRLSASVDNAVLEALDRISDAAPVLRQGLTEEAASSAVKQLRELLKCVAVAMAAADGTMLAWAGGANEHYLDLTAMISRAIANRRKEHVDHRRLDCREGGRCPMRAAVIVPLVVDGADAGALVMVGAADDKRLIRTAGSAAQFVVTQLELAQLDETKQQTARAEVRALRAQISPHFVYNALNTISSLIRTDQERARDLLREFAEFTRYSFRTSHMYTTLQEEMRNIDRYLTIEQARYGDRLQIRERFSPEVMHVTVPFLVLQPLVENAVKHGIAKKPAGGTVTVVAQDHGAQVLISVEDDGVGMDADLLKDGLDSHKGGAHVGLGNINQRMQMVYGNEYALVVDTAPDAGMKITLRVPKYARGVRPELPTFGSPTHDDSEDGDGDERDEEDTAPRAVSGS